MTGETVFLRALELSDIAILYAFENDTAVWNISETLAPYSSFALEQYILEAVHTDIYTSKQVRLAICSRSDGKVIGLADLFNFSPKHLRADVGMLIHADYRENGYAAEALKLLSEYAFSTLNMHQLVCNITPDNTASIRLFQKQGFVLVGTKKEWLRLGDSWVDEQMYQKLRIENF
ncbi:MAG: GNAT family N-acetyltransferase [Bacteroidales bacterium]|jgi:diamine N-acetyltransferase|nr:GNAT family N-acetyltransferase [Bacteroidales bacterium]